MRKISKTENTVYPPEAYAPNGELWWRLRFRPGTKRKFGDEAKLAAWLTFNLKEGDTFTMADLRRALGDDAPNDAEHLNRRLRNLRPDGWIVPTNKDDRTLPVGTYRIDAKGWHPGLGPRPKRDNVSAAQRRRVFERDGRRCVICGIGSNEPYPGEPNSHAVLTVGHRIPRDRGGSNQLDNLQTECKRCNETVRQEISPSETLSDLLLDLKRLRKQELQILLEWMEAGHRVRNRVDMIYDRARRLSAAERDSLIEQLHSMLHGSAK